MITYACLRVNDYIEIRSSVDSLR
eukprot:UN07770